MLPKYIEQSALSADFMYILADDETLVILTSAEESKVAVPIPIRPALSMRNLSLPAVSTENVSAAGNLIFVSVSPVCFITSGIDMSLLASNPPVTLKLDPS